MYCLGCLLQLKKPIVSENNSVLCNHLFRFLEALFENCSLIDYLIHSKLMQENVFEGKSCSARFLAFRRQKKLTKMSKNCVNGSPNARVGSKRRIQSAV